MLNQITWIEETRNLSVLRPLEKNPRRISKVRYDALVRDIKERGYSNRIKINLDNTIAGGHQRKKALKECGFDTVKVLVPSRLLTKKEFEREVIADNLPYGEYDHEILSNEWDAPELIEFGMDPEWLIGDVVGEEKPQIDPDPSKSVCDKCGKVV